eukprot:11051198-Alexandrium_andersonii.AAC.1
MAESERRRSPSQVDMRAGGRAPGPEPHACEILGMGEQGTGADSVPRVEPDGTRPSQVGHATEACVDVASEVGASR